MLPPRKTPSPVSMLALQAGAVKSAKAHAGWRRSWHAPLPLPLARPLGAPVETRGPRVCGRKGTLSGLELPACGPGRWWVNLNDDAHRVTVHGSGASHVLSNHRSPTAEGKLRPEGEEPAQAHTTAE